MRIRLPRLLAFLTLCTALVGPKSVALAHSENASCPGHPDAIGTSRTLVVDPLDHR